MLTLNDLKQCQLLPIRSSSTRLLMLYANIRIGSDNPNDALSATILQSPPYLIISPNSESIPMPPLGSQRDLVLRVNGFYGMGDYAQYTQPFNSHYPHLSTIPCTPADESSPYYRDIRIFNDISESDMHYAEGKTMGRLKSDILTQFESTVVMILLRLAPAQKIITKADPNSSTQHPEMLKLLLNMCFNRLCDVPCTFKDTLRTYREFQRAWLTIAGYVDWHTSYKHHIYDGNSSVPVGNVLGCFTSSESTLYQMFNARIPVYYIIHPDALGSRRIKNTVDITQLSESIESEVWSGCQRIYTGPVNSVSAVDSILRAAIASFGYNDPFANAHYQGRYLTSWTESDKTVSAPTLVYPAQSGSQGAGPSSAVGPARTRKAQGTTRKGPYHGKSEQKRTAEIGENSILKT